MFKENPDHCPVQNCEEPTRLDRWLRRKYPQLTVSEIQKLIRKKLIKVNGKKPAVDARIVNGDEVSIKSSAGLDRHPNPHCHPRVGGDPEQYRHPRAGGDPVQNDKSNLALDPRLRGDDSRRRGDDSRRRGDDSKRLRVDDSKFTTLLATLKNTMIYKDENILVLNKPAGLATQGGSKIKISVDDLAEGLKFELANKPKLVHRLDKDTSGILILARTQRAATLLTRAFATGQIVKKYWAVVVGRPDHASGVIDLPITKGDSGLSNISHHEKMQIDHISGKRAITNYRTLSYIGEHATLLEMTPITGRTHQLRVHAASLGTPILGDGKYGGKAAFLPEFCNKLHLHAREVVISQEVMGSQTLDFVAPLPAHMDETTK